MTDPIRVGVIGAGAIAQVAHLPALRRMAGVEVVAICDNDIAKARGLAGHFEVRDSYDDIEDVLRYASVDAVVICTPNHLHEIHAMAALAAGALVVCENGMSLAIDVSWRHMGEAERFWFDMVGPHGSASIQPLRVFKDVHGNVVDVTPTGASGRETPFAQSYRAEWTYFLAVIKGDVNAPPPRHPPALHRVLEAIYRSADEGRDVAL